MNYEYYQIKNNEFAYMEDYIDFMFSIDRWLVPPKPKKRQILTNLFNLSRNRHHQFSFTYVRNNAPLFAFYIIFFLVNLGLIISRLVGYRHTKNLDGSRNWALMVARAAGQGLTFLT